MMAESDIFVGAAFVALISAIIIVNMYLHRHARKESVADSEVLLGELRLTLENATQPCRLLNVRDDPGAFTVRMRGLHASASQNRGIARFEIFNHNASSAAGHAPEDGGGREWRCSRDAAAAGIARIDRNDEQQLERMLLVVQSGEGVYEAVYCKAGDFMSTGGGILKLSFNGRHLGIVNFMADGAVSDALNKKAGLVKWDGASMALTLRGKKYRISGPAYMGGAFRVLGQDLKASKLPENDRMLLMCLSLFGQTHRRTRRAFGNS